jgi:hypothetical protein
MPSQLNYLECSAAERLRSVMPGCPVGDLFGHTDWQQQMLEWEQEENRLRQSREQQAAKAIGKLLHDRYGVRHHGPEEFAAEYIMYVEPVRN